jgi:site-specific DNA recombinase
MYAKIKDWHVAELYDLSGVSGKSVLEHPEAKRMLADVASGKIKALIFSKLARLGRNTRDLLDISDHFKKHGANLVSLEESIDTSTPAGLLLYTVIGALAQWEREEISARVAASIPVRARMGRNTGGRGPLGYHWVDKRLVIHPDEAATVRELYSTFLKTRRILTTAQEMNARGFRTRKCSKFGSTTVKRILIDPTYKGIKRANYSKSKGNKKSWKLKPEKDWVFFNVEPIVAEETWNEVNAIVKENAAPFPTTPPPAGKYTFSGMVICGKCGKKMYGLSYKGIKVPTYRCRTRRCNAKINEDILLEKFRDGLKEMVVQPAQLQETIKTDESAIQEKERQVKARKMELAAVEKKIDSLLDLVADGTIDRDTFSERIQGIQGRKKQIGEAIPLLEAEIAAVKASELGRDYLLAQATTLYALWDTLNADERAKIVKELLNQVIIKPSEITFEYFYLPELMPLCKSDQTHRGSWRPRA